MSLSPQLATALGRVMRKTGGDAVPLLSAAQARRPQDFWLNFELGWPCSSPGGARKPWASTVRRWRCVPRPARPTAASALHSVPWAVRTKRSATCSKPSGSTPISRSPTTTSAGAGAQGPDRRGHRALRGDHPPRPEVAGLAHNNLGEALDAKGRTDEAIEHYEEAIRLDPKVAALAHNNLGMALRAKGRTDEAIEHSRKRSGSTRSGRAGPHQPRRRLDAKGRHDEAIGHYEESIRLDPQRAALAHNNLGGVLCREGPARRGHPALRGSHPARPEGGGLGPQQPRPRPAGEGPDR